LCRENAPDNGNAGNPYAATELILTVSTQTEYGDAGDDPFEEQRGNTENAMRRLFDEYGKPNATRFTVGVLSSVASRLLDLLPPLFVGLAIDAIFLNEREFSILFVPDDWLPKGQDAQFEQSVIIVTLVAGSFAFAAAFHWTRN